MSYRDFASQAEIRRGLVLNADFRRGADRVVKQNGVIVGSPVFTPVGVDLPGTAGNYVKYNIPSHMCDVMDSGDYLTVIIEFYPDLTYTTDSRWLFVNATAGQSFYIQKRENADNDTIRVAVSSTLIDSVTTAEYGSLWNVGGRNQICFSSADGDTSIWFNGSIMTDSDATAYGGTMQPTEIYAGISNDGSSYPFPGVISFLKVFKGAKFTTDEVSAYWNHQITARPEEAASYWFFDSARHDPTNVQTLDVTKNARHLQLGDGSTPTTYPTKLAKHGYSFDGGDYLLGNTSGQIGASGSFTIECEFKCDSLSSFDALVARAGAVYTDTNFTVWRKAAGSGDQLDLFFTNAAYTGIKIYTTTDAGIQAGVMYHLVVQHTFGDVASTRFFLNGRLLSGAWGVGGSDQPYDDSGTYKLVVGSATNDAAEYPMNGKIYHAGIWEERLTTIECYDLYLKALSRRNNV